MLKPNMMIIPYPYTTINGVGFTSAQKFNIIVNIKVNVKYRICDTT